MKAFLIALFKQTLTEPRAAGRKVIAMQIPIRALWLLLGLIAVVMSLLVAGMAQVMPLPDDVVGDLIRDSPAYRSPLFFMLMQWGQAILSVFVLTWIGRIYGGAGTLFDMLAVTIWLQIVAFVLGLGVIVLGVVLPPAVPFALLAYIAWAFWITVAMIDAAHQFNNAFKALAVFVTSIVALMIGSGILAAIIAIVVAAGV